MRSVCIAMATTAAICCLISAREWDAELDKQSRESEFIVVGRITKVISMSRLNGKIVSVATIEIRRHLKGFADVKSIEIECPWEAKIDETDVVWFIGKKQENGRYLVTYWKWGVDSLYMIQPAISRTDKSTRIPGMPVPNAGKEPIAVSLGINAGDGRAVQAIRATSLRDVAFLVQFENRDSMPHSVMPCLDGSEVHWRYPHYDLEIIDADGVKPTQQGIGRCGNTNQLRTSDFVSLRPGEVFRTLAPWARYSLPPGKYRVRLAYTAKQDNDEGTST